MHRHRIRSPLLALRATIRRVACRCFVLIVLISAEHATVADDATLEWRFVDADSIPLPCRVHLYDSAGKPHKPAQLPFWRDHFVCDGTATFELKPGEYTFEIERGPEYRRVLGGFTLADRAQEQHTIPLDRIANLRERGWWSGDLHVHRPPEQIELLMRAEDLDVAPVITWWNNRNLWADREIPAETTVRFDEHRHYDLVAGEDEREGGALLFFGLKQSLPIAGASREYPSPMKFVEQARRHESVWIDIEKPFWWDVPVWLASGEVNSIGIANNHMCRSQMYESEAWGRPRDAERLPPPRGNGYWTQEIYYHMLNCGLRIPPSAGSASGVLPNPVGYNRVYVHVGPKFEYGDWWNGLAAGRSFVTNGPLLLCKANGELPGHVFKGKPGVGVNVELAVELITQDPVSEIEVVQDGRVVRRIPTENGVDRSKLERLEFQQSGWFLVRAIADNRRTFRFASTAPYYVEIGPQKRRVSKQSAQFFLDWTEERIGRIRNGVTGRRGVANDKLTDEQVREVLAYHERAQKFWRDKVDSANAE